VSGTTWTQSELLYVAIADATALATFTTEDNLQKTLPACSIPAGVMTKPTASLKVKAAGWLNAVSVAPTFTWSLRLLTTTTWSAGGILLGATSALTSVIVTQAWWFLDIDVTLRTQLLGATSTLSTTGEVRSPQGLASPFAGSMPAANTSPATATTFDVTQTYFLFLSAACGTSNASNSLQLRALKVYGEN